MFLFWISAKTLLTRFPRVRGDVPSPGYGKTSAITFSPRARGCSCCPGPLAGTACVFPACAGMFLAFVYQYGKEHGFPRVRGDVPGYGVEAATGGAFSPRARGCSRFHYLHEMFDYVFPACAGMFPPTGTQVPSGAGFPRVRGDVPINNHVCLSFLSFSPRARGCSPGNRLTVIVLVVFPACAGMFPSLGLKLGCVSCFPRMRGDVPLPPVPYLEAAPFSPRARGCSCSSRS